MYSCHPYPGSQMLCLLPSLCSSRVLLWVHLLALHQGFCSVCPGQPYIRVHALGAPASLATGVMLCIEPPVAAEDLGQGTLQGCLDQERLPIHRNSQPSS